MSTSHGFRRVAVLGCGQMGRGIAKQTARYTGVDVVMLVDTTPALAENAAQTLQAALRENGADEQALAKLVAVASIADLAHVDGGPPDLVIEAVPEILDLKERTFAELAFTLPLNTVLASNTSSMSITTLASAASLRSDSKTPPTFIQQSPKRVVGLHYFNPVSAMELIEVVAALQTDAAVVERMEAFARASGKQPVVIKDRPGFIVNRLLIAFIREAIAMLEAGAATRENIDNALSLGARHPMGPLRLVDMIGLVRIKVH